MFKLTVVLLSTLFFAGRVLAQDSFEREFSKFDKDFERLNTWKTETPASKKLKRPPVAADPHVTTQPSSPEPSAAGTVTPLHDSVPPQAPSTEANSAPEDPPAKPAKSTALPQGAKVERLARNDRLGNQISDPVMRKKVQDLYRRKDVVVQQYVFPTN